MSFLKYLAFSVLLLLSNRLCHAADDPFAVFLSHIDIETAKLWAQFETDTDHVFLKDDLETFIHSYDTDKNNHVTKGEFIEHWAQNDPELAYVSQGLFAEFDTNADGLVDSQDIDVLFDHIDKNDDGRVDEAEFRQYFRALLTVLFFIHIQSIPEPIPVV